MFWVSDCLTVYTTTSPCAFNQTRWKAVFPKSMPIMWIHMRPSYSTLIPPLRNRRRTFPLVTTVITDQNGKSHLQRSNRYVGTCLGHSKAHRQKNPASPSYMDYPALRSLKSGTSVTHWNPCAWKTGAPFLSRIR